MSKKDWTNDWATFVRELDAAYNAGATNRKICKQFGDTEVTWVGVVDSTNIGHSSAKRRGACLTINPEDTPLHRPDGTTYTMGLVVLRIPKEKEEQWKGVSKGDKVRFRAVLPQWILSPSKQLNFTRNQPTPTCTDGELLEVLPAGKPDLKASSDAASTSSSDSNLLRTPRRGSTSISTAKSSRGSGN